MRRLLVFSAAFIVIYIILLFSGQSSHDGVGYTAITAFLLISMAIILLGCELFANGVECIGDRLELSHATSGSILAAVGTALPETLLPILALIFGEKNYSESIAVGAILGAPFMLSTLAFFLVGTVSSILWLLKKRERAVMQTNLVSLKTELLFFIATMIIILIVSLIGNKILNHISAFLLLMIYVLFVKVSLSHSSEEGEEYTEHFHFSFIMDCPSNLTWIIIQIFIGLTLIVIGAHIFVNYITLLSIKSGISSLILSLLIAPVATELPEKFNSITWTIKRKDTLAVSNITGAMVFQSAIPVSVGLLFTKWHLGGTEMLNILFSLSMAVIAYIVVKVKGILPSWLLMCGGIFYLIYIFKIFNG
ncbi:MAG: sodium:calcium antiporter [Nitrospirae bacterium]|nr:sodium:calcium antiporter [Nitrospirota bacterium]